MHPSSPFHVLIQDIFEGQRLTVIAYRDRRAFLAIEIGRILGYGQFGRDLVRQMNDEWAAEIRAPEHKAVLLGEELAAFKASPANLGGDSPQVDPRAPSVTLLTEQGLYRVLMLTGKPVGIRLRDWLDSDALPKIAATGGYGQPQIEGPAPEPKPAALSPVDVKLAIADRMLAANDKAGAKKVLRAAAVEVGVDFGRPKRIEAAPTAQLELPLVPAAPTPAPAPTGPRPKWLRDAPPADGNDWPGLVRAWLSKYGLGAIVTSADLLQLGIVVPDSPNDAGRASKLGRALHKRIDTVIAGCRITRRNSTVRGYALQKA